MTTTIRKASENVPPVPAWYGCGAVLAAAVLPVARLEMFGLSIPAPILTPGEWLLLPLGALALAMGLLPRRANPGSVLPPWLSALAPALLWLAAMLLGAFKNGVGASGVETIAAWTARLVFPALAFLPLLIDRNWRDKLFLALAAGVVANVLAASWQIYSAGGDDPVLRGAAGFLDSSSAYGLLVALFLPLLADWRGGERGPGSALFMLLCMFLIPAFSLMSVLSGGPLFAAFLGLLAAWAMWRGYAWIIGVFVCLVVFGYGSEAQSGRDLGRRRAIAQSAGPTAFDGGRSYASIEYGRALGAFAVKPFFGDGAANYHHPEAARADLTETAKSASPWYASLLGGSGIVGLGMWLALAAELLARAAGRSGRLLFGPGTMGGAVALLAAGVWTDVLPPGAGAFAGLLLALSVVVDDQSRSPKPAAKSASRPSPKPRTPANAASPVEQRPPTRRRPRQSTRVFRPPADESAPGDDGAGP